MLKVAVLVSGGGTNLQAILDQKTAGHLPSCEISLVLSSKRDVYALKRAGAYGIQTAVVEKARAEDTALFGQRLLETLQAHGIEFIVLAGFLAIVPENVISAYEDRIINVHPSLIPSFCGPGFYGLKVHEAALLYGAKVTGATVHYVNTVVDGGKIIAQKAVAVLPGDTAETLQQRVMREAEWELLPAALEACAKGVLECKSRM